jgi:hypothetical protein
VAPSGGWRGAGFAAIMGGPALGHLRRQVLMPSARRDSTSGTSSPHKPASPEALLATLPSDRAAELARVREVIREHLPAGYEEVVQRDMIVYQVPKARYPDTYNGHPLWYAALAAPKSYLTLHLMPVYSSPALLQKLEAGFRAAGKRLDIGKACIHFRKADDLALDAIAMIVAALPVDDWVALARAARQRSRETTPAGE